MGYNIVGKLRLAQEVVAALEQDWGQNCQRTCMVTSVTIASRRIDVVTTCNKMDKECSFPFALNVVFDESCPVQVAWKLFGVDNNAWFFGAEAYIVPNNYGSCNEHLRFGIAFSSDAKMLRTSLQTISVLATGNFGIIYPTNQEKEGLVVRQRDMLAKLKKEKVAYLKQLQEIHP